MNKKAKRYDDGGDVETDTAQGQNASIGDDVRSRAMAAMANRDMDIGGGGASTPTPAKKAVGKAITKAAAEEKSESKAAPTKQQKSAPAIIRGSKSTGTDLKSALFGSSASSDSPRMRAAKRDQAMTGTYSMKSGGKVSSASKRADGIAQKGKTKGKMC